MREREIPAHQLCRRTKEQPVQIRTGQRLQERFLHTFKLMENLMGLNVLKEGLHKQERTKYLEQKANEKNKTRKLLIPGKTKT